MSLDENVEMIGGENTDIIRRSTTPWWVHIYNRYTEDFSSMIDKIKKEHLTFFGSKNEELKKFTLNDIHDVLKRLVIDTFQYTDSTPQNKKILIRVLNKIKARTISYINPKPVLENFVLSCMPTPKPGGSTEMLAGTELYNKHDDYLGTLLWNHTNQDELYTSRGKIKKDDVSKIYVDDSLKDKHWWEIMFDDYVITINELIFKYHLSKTEFSMTSEDIKKIDKVIIKLYNVNNIDDIVKAQIFLGILNDITSGNRKYLGIYTESNEEKRQEILQELIKKHIPETKNTEGNMSKSATNKKYERKYMKYKMKYLSLKKLFHS